MREERAPGGFLGPDVAVDRFVADREQLEPVEPAGDLFRTPILPQQLLDLGPVGCGELAVAPRAGPASAGIPVGELGAIAAVAVGAIALHLAPDRAAVAAQNPGDRRATQPSPSQQTERISFGSGDLAVQHWSASFSWWR